MGAVSTETVRRRRAFLGQDGAGGVAAPLSACQLAAEVAAGQRRAVEVCRAALEVTSRRDRELHAFLELTPQRAIDQAQRVDAEVAAGREVGPLAGVPVAIKDNICTAFGHTTCGSRMLATYVSPYSATVVDRVEQAGGLIIGKTNLDEFAMGSSNEQSAFFPTCNPWNLQRVPGGSSGGSAAAVAARLVPLALGSDTGGSVRQPAAMCGVVGLKPTYGRVSRYGLVAYASSLDQIGVFATNVEDAALLLTTIAGRDPQDATSAETPAPDYRSALAHADAPEVARSLVIGVPKEYLTDDLDPEVREAVLAALDEYRRLGSRVVEVALPHAPLGVAAYYILATAECSSNLARFDGLRYGHRASATHSLLDLYLTSRAQALGAEVKRRILLGTFVLSRGYYQAYYDKAARVRRLIREDFDRALAWADVLAGPTTPTPAFELGEKLADPLQMYLADAYTIAVNLAGLPAISIPCGFSRTGLPLGLQLIGPAFGEVTLLRAAWVYQRATDWHLRSPP